MRGKWSFKSVALINFILCPLFPEYAASQVTNVANAQVVPSANADNSLWSYTAMENGGEKTKRVYLLVLSKDELVQVESDCHKDEPGEARYGICEHHLRFVPSGKTAILNDGEDVVLANSPFGEIATIQYGCCASPDIVTFYDYGLNPIGKLNVSDKISGGWFGISIWLQNISEVHMFVESIDKISGHIDNELLSLKEKGRIIRTPIDIEYSDPESCGGQFESFQYNSGKPMLSFKGSECDTRRWFGTCEQTETKYRCLLKPIAPK